MRETIRYSLVLFFICSLAGLSLSLVYAITQPRIQEAQDAQLNLAIKEILPEIINTKKIQKDALVYYSAFDNKRNPLGYIVTCEAKGYGGPIRVLVSVNLKKQILAVKILEQKETPGIGSKITEESFLQRFKGKTSTDFIDTISGATISSTSVIKSVKEALDKIFSEGSQER